MTCVPSGLISLWIATGSSRTSNCPSVDSQWDGIPFRHPLLSPSTSSNRLCNAQHMSIVSSAAAVLCNLIPFSKILQRPRHGLQTTHRLIPSEMEFQSAIHCSVRQCQVIDYANAQHVSLVSSVAAVLCNLIPVFKIPQRPRHGLQTTHRLIPGEMDFHSAIHCSVRQCQVIDYAMHNTWASCHRLQQCCVILSLSSKSSSNPLKFQMCIPRLT